MERGPGKNLLVRACFTIKYVSIYKNDDVCGIVWDLYSCLFSQCRNCFMFVLRHALICGGSP
jgi:hypothetical protein